MFLCILSKSWRNTYSKTIFVALTISCSIQAILAWNTTKTFWCYCFSLLFRYWQEVSCNSSNSLCYVIVTSQMLQSQRWLTCDTFNSSLWFSWFTLWFINCDFTIKSVWCYRLYCEVNGINFFICTSLQNETYGLHSDSFSKWRVSNVESKSCL